MADGSFQERTEAPTPRRREEARKKGQVAKSPEVGAALMLLVAAGLVSSGGAGLAGTLRSLFGTSVLGGTMGGPEAAASYLRGAGFEVLGGLLPILLTLAGLALVVGAVQARGVLTTEPLQAKWEKLSPLKNAGRLWGWRAPAELAKSMLKFGIVAGSVYVVLSRAMEEMPALSQQSPVALMMIIRTYTVRLLVSAGVAFLVLALADYGFQLWQHERQLRMSRQEIKDENKESEGDPNVKARRRSMARSLARRRMLLAVSQADVVVTNPTHVAVALKYDPDVADAPTVLAMGERKVAERIKALAAQSGVPTVENRPLARALLATARVGHPIPVELYVAVAEILAFIMKQRRKAGRRT